MGGFTPTLREILRYGYGGGLTIFSIALLWADSLSAALSFLESRWLLAGAIALPLGAVVYAIHRSSANDYVFEPLAHLHRKKHASECMLRHLEDMGVKGDLQFQLNTYRAVRDTCMTPEVRNRLHVQNSEITLIHLSFSILGPVSLILLWRWIFDHYPDGRLVTTALVIAVGLLLLGANATSRICRQQYVALKALEPGALNQVVQRIISSAKKTA